MSESRDKDERNAERAKTPPRMRIKHAVASQLEVTLKTIDPARILQHPGAQLTPERALTLILHNQARIMGALCQILDDLDSHDAMLSAITMTLANEEPQ